MAQEGALAERALTTAWDAFEERFSWQSFADLRLQGRLCLCSRALATVNAVRGPSPIVGRITIAEEQVRFAILFALREVFRQLLKRAGLEHAPPHSKCSNRSSSGGSHTPDPGNLGHLSLEAWPRVAFRGSPLLEVEEGIGHLSAYPLWMIRSPLDPIRGRGLRPPDDAAGSVAAAAVHRTGEAPARCRGPRDILSGIIVLDLKPA